MSKNPESVLFSGINALSDLDTMDESVW